uniref:Uncharacterized protein n=1 Tax=Heterosigma akashiwo TaxID=2829 RepID=A0A7S3XVW8_HETAK
MHLPLPFLSLADICWPFPERKSSEHTLCNQLLYQHRSGGADGRPADPPEECPQDDHEAGRHGADGGGGRPGGGRGLQLGFLLLLLLGLQLGLGQQQQQLLQLQQRLGLRPATSDGGKGSFLAFLAFLEWAEELAGVRSEQSQNGRRRGGRKQYTRQLYLLRDVGSVNYVLILLCIYIF